ncbi:hypothetical protein [Streptomyces sp. HUAS TT20]|uniref:hypothetical protein n=1 Tax=Streptomyces sp. HUAS TT20 TaxID=3447509 RepID=UPI0021D8CCB9|nr:hypothetical protein [Streptomyces sp. HUAS 15-9]UXY25475.1 hypothetical protein N8I87_02105 [Streptomyces sp. HUAS 15-9]
MDDLLADVSDLPDRIEPRLPLLTESEAYQLVEVLQHFGTMDHDWGARARHFAAELAARAPSPDM